MPRGLICRAPRTSFSALPGICAFFLALLAGIAVGDEAESTESGDEDSTVRNVKPDTEVFWLRDESGELQQVLDMTFEDFVRFYQLARELANPDRPPRFSIQNLTVVGAVDKNWADLEVTAKILPNDKSWVRVPLRLKGAILQAPIEVKASTGHVVSVDSRQGGYVLWLRGQQGAIREVKLKVFAPIMREAGEATLSLPVPWAATSSLRLTTTEKNVVAASADDTSPVETNVLQDGRTEFLVKGLGSEVRLSWQTKKASRETETPPALAARGELSVDVGGIGKIVTQAVFDVRSEAGPFTSFDVLLPPGAQLTSGVASGCVVEPIEAENDAAKRQRLTITPEVPTVGPIRLELNVQHGNSGESSSPSVEVAAFDIVGSVSQSGHVAVLVQGDALADWALGDNVVRVKELPETLENEAVAGRFAYFAQPCSLTVHALAKETRIRVEPRYEFFVRTNEVLLSATFDYDIQGAETDYLEVDFTDWAIEQIGPDDLVHIAATDLARAAPLGISLKRAVGGNRRIAIQARQAIPATDEPLTIRLPRPYGSSVNGAVVSIQPDNNVELSPRDELSQGIDADVSRTGDGESSLTADVVLLQPPLLYRDRADQSVSQFVADLTVHSRRVSVVASGDVDIARDTATVRQHFDYRIAYGPISEFLLYFPEGESNLKRLTFRIDGEQVDPYGELPAGGDERNAQPTPIKLSTGQILFGTHAVEVTFDVEMPALRSGEPTALEIPLFLPPISSVDGAEENGVLSTVDLSSLDLSVGVPKGVAFECDDQGWKSTRDASRQNGRTTRFYRASPPVAKLPLSVTKQEEELRDTVVIERAWVQTWLTQSLRRDRAAFRLTTSESVLRLQLPESVMSDKVEALVDRRLVEVELISPQLFQLTLPPRDETKSVVVELCYPVDNGRPSRGAMSLRLPSIVNSKWVRRAYWQLIVPSDEYVWRSPVGLTSEHEWKRSGLKWGRQPTWGQPELERWVGASSQSPIPEGSHTYLFGAFTPVTNVELTTISRSWLLLPASGGVLAFALLLVYFSVLRRPAALLLFAFVVFAGAIVVPEAALLVAQAAGLGLALAMLGLALEWLFVRRRLDRGVVRGVTAPALERSTTQTTMPYGERPPGDSQVEETVASNDPLPRNG
jgi:hypothetical protein